MEDLYSLLHSLWVDRGCNVYNLEGARLLACFCMRVRTRTSARLLERLLESSRLDILTLVFVRRSLRGTSTQRL